MRTLRLGKAGLAASNIGLGCMGMAGGYGPADESQALATIHAALDLGMNLLNTADFYGAGENERLIGRAISARRDDAVIVTKIGMRPDENGRPTRIDGAPAYLAQACEGSLKRLGIDAIDVLVLCRVDPNVPIEESVGALGGLVDAGKAKEVGLSEASSGTIRRAHAVHSLAVLETEYSLWERHVESDILPTLSELGIALLAYSPLGRGFLTGRISSPDALDAKDLRRHNPRFQAGNFEQNRVFIDALEQIAREKSATPAQIGLAWLLSRDPDIIPIPGTKRAERVSENAAAADIQLSHDDIIRLDAMLPSQAAGKRYPAAFMRFIDHGN